MYRWAIVIGCVFVLLAVSHGSTHGDTRNERRVVSLLDDTHFRRGLIVWDPAPGKKVVRGGSFHDRPKRCRSAFRLGYPSWQRVHNVGFRVVLVSEKADVARVEGP